MLMIVCDGTCLPNHEFPTNPTQQTNNPPPPPLQGYNGSQNWDTSFLVQALAESGLVAQFPDAMRKAYRCAFLLKRKNMVLRGCFGGGGGVWLLVGWLVGGSHGAVPGHILTTTPSITNSLMGRYFDRTQIKEDEEDREYWFRHISKGACRALSSFCPRRSLGV